MCAPTRRIFHYGPAGGGYKFQPHLFQLISFLLNSHGGFAALPGKVKNTGRLPIGVLGITLR
jgi:hypothetical protein